jgi:hypothetical protein
MRRWSTVALAVLMLLATDALARGRKGHLVIDSMTEGAKVYVDGKLVGKTPIEKPIPLRPGKHRLKATKAGHSTLEMQFKIRARKKTEMMVELLPFSGLVKFSANIDGAEVYVDNKLIGHTPLIRDVVAGDHKVLILKEGYNDFESDINVKAGEKMFVEGSLTPFKDISPEVLAMAKAEEEKKKQEEALARELAETGTVATAPPWYADLYKKWWVWAIAGAVVVTAVTIPLAMSGGGEQAGLHRHDDSPNTTIDIRQ